MKQAFQNLEKPGPLTCRMDDQRSEIELTQCFETLLKEIGENPNREGLVDTPKRAAKAMAFLTSGYKTDVNDVINGALFESDIDDMVMVKNIEFYSLCEHHLLPFFGKCHIAYVPNKKVLGLSKLARIVDVFARRLQIQEGLTSQIAHCIEEVTQPRGVAVVIEAKHLCMMMRGVEKQVSSMRTQKMLGEFLEKSARMEFLESISSS